MTPLLLAALGGCGGADSFALDARLDAAETRIEVLFASDGDLAVQLADLRA
jgi:hypothetical protein